MRQGLWTFVLVLILAIPLAAATWQVTSQNYEFVPPVLAVTQGDTVVWTNVQGSHNILNVCDPALFGNAVADAPWVYTFVFDVPVGAYPYVCEVHPDIMVGTIEVLPVTRRWEVTVQDFSFTPANLAIQQGDTVVWTNILGFHNVHHLGDPSLFGTEIAGNPWTYSFVFDLPGGLYPYVCEVHPDVMTGSITVQTPPAAPVSVVIRPFASDVILRWPRVPGAGCYSIWRSQNPSDEVFATLVGSTTDTFYFQSHAAIPPKQFFQIRAIAE